MEFYVNHPILYILAGALVAVVLGQSVYFLVKALRRSKALGMDSGEIKDLRERVDARRQQMKKRK